jgi:hypothetical protein
MPTFTVSTTGGNWSSGATWVGGVAPNPTGDDIIVPAGAGNLVVDINRSCLTIIFQAGYTNTFTIANGITLTVTGTAITLVSGMTYNPATTGILSTNANQATITITFAGITIPYLAVGHNSGAGLARSVVISGTTPTVSNFIFSNTPTGGAVTLSGPAINITNSFAITATGDGTISGTTPLLSGTVTLTQTGGRNNCGFTALTLSTVIIGGNIVGLSGPITFQTGSSLAPGLFTVRIDGSCTLDTNVVTWYNLTFYQAGTTTLTSNLNISNNLFFDIAVNNRSITSSVSRSINVQGSVTSNVAYAFPVQCTNIVINLIGFGTYAVSAISGVTININSSNPSGYILGSASFTGANYIQISGTLNLVGTTVASAFASTVFRLAGTLDINKSSIGGSNIILGEVGNFGNMTFNSDTFVSGNVSSNAFGGNSNTFNGSKLSVGGNLTFSGIVTSISGTSTIEFYGSSNSSLTFVANSTITNNIIINKSSPASVSLLTSVTWGAAGRTFNVNTGSSLILLANLTMAGGTMTFLGTATLTPNLNTLFLTTSAAKTLNTSTVTWYNVTNNTLTNLVTLTSNLNMSNNLSFTNTFGSGGCGFTGAFNVNVSGGLLANDTGFGTLTFTGGGVVNMIGSGVIESSNQIGFTININTTSSGYVLGNATRPTLLLSAPFNLLGTSIVTVFSSTLHNLSVRNGAVINTNNTPTGANLAGGTQILWGNLNSTQTGTTTVTISQPIIVQNNFTTTSATTTMTCNGAKILVRGTLNCFNLTGTSDIELDGTTAGTWGSAVQVNTITNNVAINKTSGASVSILGSITWGAAGKVLTKTSGNINAGTSTITTPGVSVTINDFTFWNLTVSTGGTIIQNVLNTINNNLTLNGSATFQGTAGWVCANLVSLAAGTFTVTLQQLITYRTRLQAFITGGVSTTVGTTIISSGASTRAIWTLDQGASQSLIYVNGTRIDSSQGQTVWTFGGLISTTPVGAETLNWNIGSPPGTFAYTFLN